MRLTTAIAAAGLTLWAGAASAASLEIKDAVARVVVIPEARSDIKVEVTNSNANLPLEVRSHGDRTIVDGGLDRRIRSCQNRGGRRSVSVNGIGSVGWDEFPQLVIRTPKDVVIEAGGAVFGSVGRSSSLKVFNAGCGDWTVANVAGRLVFNQAGSGDAKIGSAQEAHLRVAGSGDVAARQIAAGLEVDIAGSGNVDVAEANGLLEVKIAGSGDVDVAAGKASDVTVSVAGSGDVSFGGTAETLKARIAGSGDVRVKAVSGEVKKTVVGSGSVTVG